MDLGVKDPRDFLMLASVVGTDAEKLKMEAPRAETAVVSAEINERNPVMYQRYSIIMIIYELLYEYGTIWFLHVVSSKITEFSRNHTDKYQDASGNYGYSQVLF